MLKIFYKDVKFRLRKTKEIKNWIVQVIRSEEKEPGDLSFIFVNDKYIRKINKEFLAHDYYTDVIAFDYGEGKIIKGEIYIGIETIRRNTKIYRSTLKNEILRVMIHGVLHLIGYNDTNEIEKKEIRRKEDEYIKKFSKGKNGF